MGVREIEITCVLFITHTDQCQILNAVFLGYDLPCTKMRVHDVYDSTGTYVICYIYFAFFVVSFVNLQAFIYHV
jgi:hypothetical protein